MKKMTIVLAMVVVVVLVATVYMGCKFIKGQVVDGPGMERDTTDFVAETQPAAVQAQDLEPMRAFVEQFYNGWENQDVLNYDYPKQYITPNLLKYLADAYDYECEGECLATWKFFYEGGGDVAGLQSTEITARDESHVLVKHKYDNYEYDILLKVIKDGDTFKIDSLEQVRSEYK